MRVADSAFSVLHKETRRHSRGSMLSVGLVFRPAANLPELHAQVEKEASLIEGLLVASRVAEACVEGAVDWTPAGHLMG
jgi:hypothetical protein